MAAKFELKQAKDGQYIFNLKAGNGEVILTSELYHSQQSAKQGIESVKANAENDARYDRKTASNGNAYFTLKAGNGEIIGQSEMYSTVTAMEKGIASVKANAPSADMNDATAPSS